MSSQKESLKKKIFKKSMFAASAAMILASTSALGTANRNVIADGTIAGNRNITVIPTINTVNSLSVGLVGDLILGNVNSGINYTAGTNLTVNDVNGNVDFKGQVTAVLNLTANSKITGAVDSTGGVGGKLNLAADTTVTGVIGGTKPLTAVNFNGKGINNLIKTSNAELFTVSGGVTAVAYGLMTGAVNYGGAGTLIVINGINGAVTSSAGGGETLTIYGGDITGSIGATNPINALICDVNNSDSVTIKGNVAANSIVLTKANIIDVRGNLTSTGTGVDFQKAGGILVFRETSPEPHTFASPIVNGGNGTVEVYTNLIAKNADIGTLKAIIIGDSFVPGALTIAVDATSLNLVGTINIDTAGSQLTIASTAEQTVTFNGNRLLSKLKFKI